MAADPRTVTLIGPDGTEHHVTPEVAKALEAGSYGTYERDGDTSAADDRVAELEAQVAELQEALDYVVAVGAELEAQLDDELVGGVPMPEKADERVAWIGDDPRKARRALADEEQRGEQARKTVTDHARSVLDTNPNDPAGPGQED